MLALNTVIVLFGAAIVSCAVDSIFGLNEGIMVYDVRTERMVYMPTRYDVMMNVLVRC